LHWNVESAPPLLRPSPRSFLYDFALPFAHLAQARDLN